MTCVTLFYNIDLVNNNKYRFMFLYFKLAKWQAVQLSKQTNKQIKTAIKNYV